MSTQLRTITLEDLPGWSSNFGKRYLDVKSFISLCNAVGLDGCTEAELEEYERERWMFPAARIVMPENYAQAFSIQWPLPDEPPDFDLRHPIDQKIGTVEGLFRPSDRNFVPWQDYPTEIQIDDQTLHPAALIHCYHHWQIYELYEVRRYRKGMYKDNAVPIWPPRSIVDGSIGALGPFLDAVSRYHHLYAAKEYRVRGGVDPDEEGVTYLSPAQVNELEQAAQLFAGNVIREAGSSEEQVYEYLRGLMHLHHKYEQSERVRLAESLRVDIWRVVQFIHYAYGTALESIAARAGKVARFVRDYLEVIFPNRRAEARTIAQHVLRNFAQEHNRRAPNFAMADADIDELLTYAEGTDLALVEYVLDQINETYFDEGSSWQNAELFVLLKSLASLPESLAKILILNSSDNAVKNSLGRILHPSMGSLNQLTFQNSVPAIWTDYCTADHSDALTLMDFTNNFAHLDSHIAATTTESDYLGADLSLATLLRNFTSHLLVENPQLTPTQYLRCVRAVASATFLVWKVAKLRGWV